MFLKNILILSVIIFLLNSCAKPRVVNVVSVEDRNLNCEQLELEIAETQKIKKDAEFAKDGTGGNITRMLLFWPAWAQTLHNADVAIQAANDRNYHLINLMKKKNCKGVNVINSSINQASDTNKDIPTQLRILKKMYKSGDLTSEEYKKAKAKILE